jgi:hypothetical protein
MGNENGITQGQCVGRAVLDRIDFRHGKHHGH